MQRLIVITFSLLTALIPLVFLTSTYELFEFPKFIVLLSGTLVIAATWFTHAVTARDWSLRSYVPPRYLKLIDWSVLGILLTQLVTTLTSIHPYTSFWGFYSRFHQGLLTTICYTILYFAAVKWLDKQSTQKLVNISLKTSVVIGLIAVLEHLDISLTCLLMTGFLKLQNLSSPLISSTACWGGLTNPLSRSFATLGQPNWLAAYLLPHFFLLAYNLRLKSDRLPLATFLTFGLLFTALLFTASRSGFLAFALSALTWFVLSFKSGFGKTGKTFLLLGSFLLLLALLLGTPYTPALPRLFQKSQATTPAPAPTSGTVLETVGGTASSDIRKIVWSGTLRLIANHPWLGTGPETFAYTYYWVRPEAHNYTSEWEYLYNKAHNEYLNLAATSGLVGLTAYLLWHYALFATTWVKVPKSKKVDKENEHSLTYFLPVLAASVVAFSVTNFFGFSVIPVYFLLVLFSALPSSFENTPPETAPEPAHTWVLAGSVILLLLFPLRLLLADIYFAKGKSYLETGRQEEAITLLSKAVAIRPQEDLFHTYLGEAYAAPGKGHNQELAAQEAGFTRAHNPYSLNYYKSRAKIYLSLAAADPAYYTPAAAELVQARVLAPTDPKLAYNLGLVYSRLGDIGKTEAQMNDAIELKKNYQDPYYALTLIYEQTKQEAKIPNLLQTARENLATYSGLLKEKMEKYNP